MSPFGITSNVQQSWFFAAFDGQVDDPVLAHPGELRPEHGCIMAAPAVPQPSAAAVTAAASSRNPLILPP